MLARYRLSENDKIGIALNVLINPYIIFKERVKSKAKNRLDFILNIIFEIERDWMNKKKARGYVKEKHLV